MRKYSSTSTERPPEWDTVSCPDLVYHNHDVTEEPATDENPAMFHYEVEEYTRLEYLEHKNAETMEALDMILSGVTE